MKQKKGKIKKVFSDKKTKVEIIEAVNKIQDDKREKTEKYDLEIRNRSANRAEAVLKRKEKEKKDLKELIKNKKDKKDKTKKKFSKKVSFS